MAYSVEYKTSVAGADGTENLAAITFDYLKKSQIEVRVSNAGETLTAFKTRLAADSVSALTYPSQYTIDDNKVITLAAAVLANGSTYQIEVRRNTGLTTNGVDYTDGATVTEANLDDSQTHLRQMVQELEDNKVTLLEDGTISASISGSSDTVTNLSGHNVTELDDVTNAGSGAIITSSERTKLTNIEENADVTDTANVTAAGALMDSELTDLAGVKGVTISTLQPKPSEGAFVDGDKTKLDGIESGATADQTGAEIKAAYEGEADTNAFTDADHTKLDGIETGATADQSDSEIKTAYENNADTNAFTDADHSKLDGIEASATANDTDANLKSRANHTGTQTASTISDFDTEVANNSAVTANTAKVTNATHTGDATGSGALTVVAIQGRAVQSSAPSDGEVLKWNDTASEWQAMADNNSGGGGGGTPAGSTGQVQFNSGGSFGADSSLVWDNVNDRLGIGTSAPSSPNSVSKFLHIHDSDHCSLVMSDDSNTWEIVSNLALTFRDGTDTRLTIDSSGKLGVGSTSPTGIVSLQGDFGTTETAGLYIQNDGTGTADDVSPIAFTTRSSGWGTQHAATIAACTSSTSDGGAYLTFKTSTTGQYAPTERLRITSSGTVEVNTPSSGTAFVANLIDNTAAGFIVRQGGNGYLSVDTTNSSESIEIGNTTTNPETHILGSSCGIGTTAPSEKLSVSSGNILIDNNQSYRSKNTSGTVRSLLTLSTDDNLYVQSPSDITFQTNQDVSTVNAMTVDSSGNVGVGTGSSVNTKLHVRGNSDTSEHDCSIRIVDADGTSGSIDPNLQFWTDSGQLYQIRANDSSGLQFRNSSDVTKVTFDDDGNVGVGVTDFSSSGANAKLAVNAGFINVDDDYGLVFGGGTGRPAIQGSKADGEIYITNANFGIGSSSPSGKLEVNTGSGIAYFTRTAGDDGSTNPALGFATDSTKPLIRAYGDGLVFETAAVGGTASERMRIASDGAITGGGLKLYGGILGHKDSDASSITLVGGNSSSTSGANITLGGTSGSATREVIFKSNATETMRIASTGRVTVKKSSNAEVTALTDGATITPDLDDANNFSLTLGGNRTLANPSNCTAGQSGIITITQDGTGSRTLAYGSYWKFSGGTAPTLTTTASAVDVLAYYVESADRITATLITDTK